MMIDALLKMWTRVVNHIIAINAKLNIASLTMRIPHHEQRFQPFLCG